MSIIKIAEGSYHKRSFSIAPGKRKKRFIFQSWASATSTTAPTTVLPNTVFFAVVKEGGRFRLVTLQNKDGNSLKTIEVEAGGELFIMAALKIMLPEYMVINGLRVPQILSYYKKIQIGEDTGTGEEFTGTLAAQVNLTYSVKLGSQSSPPTANTRNSIDIPKPVLDGLPKGYLFPIFSRFPLANSVIISIDKDKQHRKMLEESVNLHVFKENRGDLTLHNVINTFNEDSTPRVPNSGYLLALIAPVVSSADTSEEVDTFEIGDPRTDARVKVTEEDV